MHDLSDYFALLYYCIALHRADQKSHQIYRLLNLIYNLGKLGLRVNYTCP